MGMQLPRDLEEQILSTPGVLVNGKPLVPPPQEAAKRTRPARPKKDSATAAAPSIPPVPQGLAKAIPFDPYAEMNKTERAYAELVLNPMIETAQIILWRFQPMTFVLANRARYTPDFMLLFANGRIRFAETKALWKNAKGGHSLHFEDDALVKLKVAASMYPFFEWVAVGGRKLKGVADWEWQTKPFVMGE